MWHALRYIHIETVNYSLWFELVDLELVGGDKVDEGDGATVCAVDGVGPVEEDGVGPVEEDGVGPLEEGNVSVHKD